MIRLIALLALLATPLQAQSFTEAIRGNFLLATDLCMRIMYRFEPGRQPFVDGGFRWFSVEGTVNSYGVKGETRHYADAPAETVRVAAGNPDAWSGQCRAFSRHLTQSDALTLVGQAVAYRFPTASRSSPEQWVIEVPGRTPLIITVTTRRESRFPEENGSLGVSMYYPG